MANVNVNAPLSEIFRELGYNKESALHLLHDIMTYHAMHAIEDNADKDSRVLEEIGFMQNFYTLLSAIPAK